MLFKIITEIIGIYFLVPLNIFQIKILYQKKVEKILSTILTKKVTIGREFGRYHLYISLYAKFIKFII